MSLGRLSVLKGLQESAFLFGEYFSVVLVLLLECPQLIKRFLHVQTHQLKRSTLDAEYTTTNVPNYSEIAFDLLYSQCRVIIQQMQDKPEVIKAVCCGSRGVGKTSIVNYYVDGNMGNTQIHATIGIDFKIKTVNKDNRIYRVQVWDSFNYGGQRYRAYQIGIFRRSHAVLLIYDVCDPASFQFAREYYQKLKTYLAQVAQANQKLQSQKKFMFKTQIIVVGNKVDKEGERKVSRLQGEQFANERGCTFFETSALDGTNIEALIARVIGRKEQQQVSQVSQESQQQISGVWSYIKNKLFKW